MTTPATPDANGWLPIASAPKNLTEVLVCEANGDVYLAQYECHAPEPFWNFDPYDFSETIHECNPVYYQPLPTPPVSS